MRRIAVLTLLGALAGSALAQDQVPPRQPTPEQMRQMQERMARGDKAPKVGQLAPTFTLSSLDGKVTYDLTAHRDQRPVILFFGSYT